MIGWMIFLIDVPLGLILLSWPTKPYGVTADNNQMRDRAINFRIGIEVGHASK